MLVSNNHFFINAFRWVTRPISSRYIQTWWREGIGWLHTSAERATHGWINAWALVTDRYRTQGGLLLVGRASSMGIITKILNWDTRWLDNWLLNQANWLSCLALIPGCSAWLCSRAGILGLDSGQISSPLIIGWACFPWCLLGGGALVEPCLRILFYFQFGPLNKWMGGG